MKSLIFAFICFGIVLYGCFDVRAFRPIRKIARRIPGGVTGPLRATGSARLHTGSLDRNKKGAGTRAGHRDADH